MLIGRLRHLARPKNGNGRLSCCFIIKFDCQPGAGTHLHFLINRRYGFCAHRSCVFTKAEFQLPVPALRDYSSDISISSWKNKQTPSAGIRTKVSFLVITPISLVKNPLKDNKCILAFVSLQLSDYACTHLQCSIMLSIANHHDTLKIPKFSGSR